MLKRWICLFAGFAAVFLFAACSGAKREVFDLAQDYADTNGYRGWSYYCGSVLEGAIEPMYFSEYRGSYKAGTDTDNDPIYIEKTLWKPSKRMVFGQATVWEVMAGWQAPKKGKMRVTVDLLLMRAQEPGNDGVTFYVVSDRAMTEELAGVSLRADNRESKVEFDYKIRAGETLYFVLNPTDNGSNDETVVNIRLEYC